MFVPIRFLRLTSWRRPPEAVLKEFWKIFFGLVVVVFCWGFWQNWAEKRGVLVVNLWWMCGETWRFVTAFLSTENLPRITDSFWGIPVLGIGDIQDGDSSIIQQRVKAIVADRGRSLTRCRAAGRVRLREPGYGLRTTPGMTIVPSLGAAAD